MPRNTGSFRQYAGCYDQVIHISIGSGFSSGYQNASIAAAAFWNAYVEDGMNLSAGHGILVVDDDKLAGKIMDAVEIVNRLLESIFILDRLDYMQKSGRCSTVVMLGANLLKIRPCLAVRDGSMGVVEKYRGSVEHCIEEYAKDRLKDRRELCRDHVFITHTGCS